MIPPQSTEAATLRAMQSLVVASLLALIVCGCGSTFPQPTSTVASDRREIEALVTSYYLAPVQDRERFIAPATDLKDHMAQYYKERTPLAPATAVTVDDIRIVANNVRRVYATVERGSAKKSNECYLKLLRGKWLVDWEATVGFNPISLRTFKADAATGEATVRVSDYYNFQYRNKEKSHYSFAMTDVNSENLNGYVPRDSATAEQLFEITKDGAAHEVAAVIKRTGREGSVAEITSLASQSWVIE
jgi:hypothetical protein